MNRGTIIICRQSRLLVQQTRWSNTKAKRDKEKVVILGTGWAAFRMVKSLGDQYKIVVISPRNHFLFTPLLASTTTGTLEFRSIVEPIRASSIMSHATYFQANCIEINQNENKIKCEAVYSKVNFDVDYDKLVVAVGARNNTYNIEGVQENAYFIKELNDARKIRQKLLENLERATTPNVTPAERQKLLSCVVVGGGPTGVEFAGELSDLLRKDIPKAFPGISEADIKVTLLEAAPKILSAFDERLVKRAVKTLIREGVDVRTEAAVKAVRETEVELTSGMIIPYGILVWSTGVAPRPVIDNCSLPRNRGRIVTDDFLKVKGFENIYAMGDCATPESQWFLPTAQVAQQQGKYLADAFNKQAKGENVQPFKFKFMGLMTYVGSSSSLIDTPSWKFSGFFAWLAWRTAYLTTLGSWSSRLRVPFDWTKSIAVQKRSLQKISSSSTPVIKKAEHTKARVKSHLVF